MKIIITDLTRFQNPDIVCTAGVADDGTVVRPMPYLRTDECRRLDIHPGGVLEGEFRILGNDNPHSEDASHRNLEFKGACSSREFRGALEATLFDTISDGFEYDIESDDKCIPIDNAPPRSLITIKISPSRLQIVKDRYNPSKLKAHITDSSGTTLSYVAITDRGFYDYATDHVASSGDIAEINDFVHSQKSLFLRLGLGRAHAVGSRNGYWIQLNGIYTFPDYLKHIRCYQ